LLSENISVTLQEIETYWSIDDLNDVTELLDYQEDIQIEQENKT